MYRKISSSNTSRLEAYVGFFRLLVKGIFDPYVLWPFDKKLIFQLVTRISTRDFTVWEIKTFGLSSRIRNTVLWDEAKIELEWQSVRFL